MSRLPPGPTELRRDLGWLAIGAAILFLAAAGARDLWNPNEPIYGLAVAEMERAAEWLVPTVNGEAFFEKPPLYFWMARIAAALLGGVNELTLRLPSALSGITCVLLTYLLVHPYASRLRARLAAALLATTYLVFWSARSVQMDLLLSACALFAVFCGTRVLDRRMEARIGWPLFGVGVGLGLLAKGPVGLICPGLVVALYAATTGKLARLKPGHLALAAASAVLVVAPYLVALAFAGEGAGFAHSVVRQNLVRFHDPWDHQAPWWYFLQTFWIDMAPWSFVVPLALWLPDRDEGERRIDRLAWVWIVGLIVFFSLSASKRSPYILPVAPAVAVLASGLGERLVSGTLGRFRERGVLVVANAIGAVLVGAAAYLHFRALENYPDLALPGRATALLLFAGGAAVFLGTLLKRRLPVAAPTALFACVVSLYLLAAVWVLPQVDRYKSPRYFAQEVLGRVRPDDDLRGYRLWKWRAGYPYYLGRRLGRVETIEELTSYWARPERVFLIVERGRKEEVAPVVGTAPPLAGRKIGSNEVFLYSNR